MLTPQTVRRIVQVQQPGGPEALILNTAPIEMPLGGQILIQVEAAGVNRPDSLQREGKYPPPPGASDVFGLEVAGTVVALGPEAQRWQIGDKVTALVHSGGYSDYCLADSTVALPWPEGYDAIRAASLPETYFTVWSNVFQRARLESGETFLVHGGASGIGTTAIQLARAFGAMVFATAGSDERCRTCEAIGADRAINYKTEDFVAVIKAETKNRGVDVILDMVGGSYIARNYEAAAVEGRIVQIAFLEGSRTQIDFTRLMLKRLTHTGSTLRARETAFKAKIADDLETHVWPLLSAGKIAPSVDSVFKLEDVVAAHRRLEEGPVGKVILTL